MALCAGWLPSTYRIFSQNTCLRLGFACAGWWCAEVLPAGGAQPCTGQRNEALCAGRLPSTRKFDLDSGMRVQAGGALRFYLLAEPGLAQGSGMWRFVLAGLRCDSAGTPLEVCS